MLEDDCFLERAVLQCAHLHLQTIVLIMCVSDVIKMFSDLRLFVCECKNQKV